MPKLYIDEFVGISNRLETLPLAFAIRRAHGHDIVLDWRELDSFSVADTRRGRVGVLAKLGALRVRSCDRALFDTLAGRKIVLRSLDGPSELLDPIYLDAARKVQLSPKLAKDVAAAFAGFEGRPVVGIHLRQGDYVLEREDTYLVDRQWPAVPEWWYLAAMSAIQRAQPDVVFFLGSTGDPAAHAEMHAKFKVVSLELPSPYGYKGPDHASRVNPVADLFALACCPVLLATPLSGYSHWAGNVLGPASDCIVPRPGATRADPRFARTRLYGARLPRWRASAREASLLEPLPDDLSGIDFGRPARTDWL